jgi:hypothetical protein
VSAAAAESGDKTGARPARAAGGRSTMVMVFAMAGLLMPIAPASFTVVAVYLSPTFIMGCFRGLQAPGAISTVAGFNIAGLLPALYHLWHSGNDFDAALALLFHGEFLVINFAAAGLGLSLLVIAPFIARTWVDIAGQRLLRRAEAERRKLLDEWGEALEQQNKESASGDKASEKAAARD